MISKWVFSIINGRDKRLAPDTVLRRELATDGRTLGKHGGS